MVKHTTLGARVRAARIKADMTQSQLGQALHTSGNYISDIERNQKVVSLDQVLAIACVLRCNPNDLHEDLVDRPVRKN